MAAAKENTSQAGDEGCADQVAEAQALERSYTSQEIRENGLYLRLVLPRTRAITQSNVTLMSVMCHVIRNAIVAAPLGSQSSARAYFKEGMMFDA